MTDATNDPNDFDPELEADAEAGLNAHPGDDLGPIDQLIAERDQWKDRALRAVAEAENTKKRAEAQNNDARAYAIQRFARDLLGVADNLERALQAAPKDAEGAAAGLITGLEMTQKSLLSAFEANNLVRVAPAAGETFDPHLHQAMMEQPSTEVDGGKVVQTLQAGYALFGRTVRPAMVVVAARGSGAPASAVDQVAGAAAYARASEQG
ncbi:MAG: nucleotide exchange factor GrpE [Alphaproteobacteria bacterium]|nr:nucleotide exchange factor GrpE [Alphaproteobacteria bacterium]MBU2117174.1 nucleotide exchange factor GrpE [Alphaproteobacteria bacterium]MBU2352006.1 nucleotide exchange factor GrpE [Alphaproteobacteria bacterium]MBU2381542.1 nucleotide exchange factor GrpE [Alphaproteobacteria bacterium]